LEDVEKHGYAEDTCEEDSGAEGRIVGPEIATIVERNVAILVWSDSDA